GQARPRHGADIDRRRRHANPASEPQRNPRRHPRLARALPQNANFEVLEMLPNQLVDVYRPYGAGSPTTTGIPCTFIHHVGTCPLKGTHVMEVPDTADIRDGVTRTAGAASLVYADGDEIRIQGSNTRYVVIWVDTHVHIPGESPRKRVYMI